MKIFDYELNLQEAIQSRDEFFSIASHELKTPLTGLALQFQCLTKEISQQVIPAKAKENISKFGERAYKSIIALKNLINELMDITKIRAKQLKLTCSLVNLSEMLHELMRNYKEQLHQAGCQVELDIETNVFSLP